jgi:AcrR family transcriptional regulator
MNEKTYHHGDLRTALVTAGRAILSRDGLSALSLRACAREAGVSHAAPQHHFRNVAELLAAIAASGFDDFVEALETGSKEAPNPRETLIAMGKAYVRFAERDPALYRVMFGVEAPNTKTEDLNTSMGRAWTQLHDAVSAMTGRPDTASSDAMLIWSLVHGHAMLEAARCIPGPVDPAKQLAHALETIADGLTADKR